MTALEANARRARFLIGLGDWLGALGWSLLVAAVIWSAIVVTVKLVGGAVPYLPTAVGLAILALGTATVSAWIKRRNLIDAAAVLDRAADLKERTSSGLYCLNSSDPFARAVARDAEELSARISVRSFIKPSWPPSLSWASVAVVLAIVATFLPITPLQSEVVAAPTSNTAAVKQEVARARKRLKRLQERSKETNVGDLKTELQTIDNLPIERLETQASVRREAVKKLDSLADSVRKQLAGDKTRMKELKKMFRNLRNPQQPKTPSEQLSQALAKGDFRAAERAVKDMQEKLAKLKMPENEQAKREMQQQLKKLAEQMSKASESQEQKDNLQKELEQSGIDKDTIKKALKNLSKKDIDNLKSAMKKQGATDKQISDMAKKMQAMKKAAQQSSDMAQAAQKAAESMQASASDASEALQSMADQLNAMESLDQQIGELESMLSEMQDAKNDLSDGRNQCGKCQGQGQGCKSCNGSGRKPGNSGNTGQKMGLGRGGRAPMEETAVRFKKERTPVHTGKGSIVSKMFVDGEQVRGDVSTEVAELVAASEREATDAIDKNRIPNKYRAAIKHYFSRIQRELGAPEGDAAIEDGDASREESD